MATFQMSKRTLYIKYQWGVNADGKAKFEQEKFDNIKANATDENLIKIATKISTVLGSDNIQHNIKDSYDVI